MASGGGGRGGGAALLEGSETFPNSNTVNIVSE